MMKKLFMRAFILLFPLLLVGVYFLISDPMRVVHEYDSPLKEGVLTNDRLFQARWLNKHEQAYNAFILALLGVKHLKPLTGVNISLMKSFLFTWESMTRVFMG